MDKRQVEVTLRIESDATLKLIEHRLKILLAPFEVHHIEVERPAERLDATEFEHTLPARRRARAG